MNSKAYRWCSVPLCTNTSIKTPEKLFIFVPFNKTVRNKWLKLARRDLKGISPTTQLYFCEDHFDLPNDMENYKKYINITSNCNIRYYTSIGTIAIGTFGVCDYGGHCLALAKTIRENTPNALVYCKRGRQGSFEVEVNNKLVYSKLQTMALPDYEEVSQVVNEVYQGSKPREIKGQQPINCAIS